MAGSDRAGGKAGDRDKALETALAQIERQFGRGSIMRLGDEARTPIEVIPTGAISLDVALGIGGLPRGRVVEIYGPEGSGKALALDTPIPTPKGWTTMGELSPGQEVFAGDGSTTRVTFATPVMTGHECFRVRFSDGAEIIADADHQWVTTTLWGRTERWSPAVVTTREMAATLRARDGHMLNHAIQTCGPLEYPAQELPVAPYTLGAWLGDGTTDAASITCADPEILDEIRSDGCTVYRSNPWQHDRAPTYRIVKKPAKSVCLLTGPRCSASGDVIARGLCLNHYASERRNGRLSEWPKRQGGSLQAQLRNLGVLGNKHIPESYLHGSVAQRLALLQGLMDADGTVSTGGSGTGRGFGVAACEFSVTNERLARDVHELLLSLGIKLTFREAPAVLEGRRVGTRYRLGFQTDLPVFRLPRKAARLTPLRTRRAKLRYVTTVEPVSSVPVRCIQVDHPGHTYLAGRDCIPTHNTTVALHAAANAQKAGGIAAFIDAEHALDPEYAKKLGVDTDALLVSQPDTGEQALEIADMLVRSSAIDIVIIDSVAALVPRAEIEGEMGDSHVGLQARLMSQAMRKLAGALNQTKTTAIFINQLREKVGVMFGCMGYSTRITLADGTQEKIGKIVNQRMDVEVLSYDPETDRVVPRRIVNWFNNGRAERFLQLTVAKSGKNGRAQFAATENHLIRTPGGWRPVGELIPGDRVIVAEQQRLSGQQVQVILGSLMGDGALSPSLRGRSGTRFRIGHGAKQAAYLGWKVSLLENIPHTRTSNAKGAVFADFTPLPELSELREIVYFGDGKKHLSWDYLKSLTPLALAVWYMDDGCFTVRSKGVQARTRGGTGRIDICVDAMSPGSRDRLVSYLRDTHGLDVKLISRRARKQNVIQFTTAASEKFQQLVAPYVHPSMDYKLLPRFRGRFAVQPEFAPGRIRPVPARVLDIHVKPPTRSMNRFDIEVEGSHCYFVDGVMVHNSPETTSGGRALKFYASLRLDVRRIETLKDGTEPVGSRTKVKVVKNKCLAEGTRIFDPVTGITHRIEDIVDGRLPVHVASADKRGVLEAREVASWFDQGEQDVIGIKLRDGTELWVTPDHRVLTEHGWRLAGDLAAGDRLARPRAYSGFGSYEPVPPGHARLLGYLIGDGYVGGRTPVHFINVAEPLQRDAGQIAATLGCEAKPTSQEIAIAFSHRPGEKNGVLALCRWAEIDGCLAPDKKIPPAFFSPDVSAGVVGNLIFGIFETDGYVSREQTGGIRVGFATTSEQLAIQIHWLLLRWGIGSSVRQRDPHAQRGGLVKGRRISAKHPAWEVRVSGIESVSEFAAVIPAWGPRGQVVARELAKLTHRHRGSQRIYLTDEVIKPVLAHLGRRGVGPLEAAQLIGSQAPPGVSLKTVLGTPRMRRDRMQRLADALDDAFLRDVLADQLWFSRVTQILPARRRRTFDVGVEGLHNLVAEDVVVHNCAPPFRSAEFDILFGTGISREGGLIDLGVEQSIVRKSGAWYTYEGDQLGQGKENARNFLRDNPDMANEIEKKIKEKLGIGSRLDAEAGSGGELPAGANLRAMPNGTAANGAGAAGAAPASVSGTRPPAGARAGTRLGGSPGGAG